MDVFKNPLYQDLEKLNYTLNESKIYLTLIKLGPSLAGKIAKSAQMDRSSTYNALKGLIERGVVSTVHENQRTIYVPENPKKIVDYFKEKEEIAKKIIPRLQDQFSLSEQKSSVKFFRGNKGIKTVFQNVVDSLDKGDEYYVLGSEGQFGRWMPYYGPIFKARKEQKGIKTKALIREGRKKVSSKLAEYRTVPTKSKSPATFNVYKDKIAIVIWDETPQAILIENEMVAKTLSDYFEFMWKKAKK